MDGVCEEGMWNPCCVNDTALWDRLSASCSLRGIPAEEARPSGCAAPSDLTPVTAAELRPAFSDQHPACCSPHAAQAKDTPADALAAPSDISQITGGEHFPVHRDQDPDKAAVKAWVDFLLKIREKAEDEIAWIFWGEH